MTTRTGRAAVAALAAAAALIGTAATASAGPHHHGPPAHRTRHAGDCALANGIKHVIQIQFDNVHLTRDNPNVASDLEQMPHLLHFLERNGVVLANTHDVLSHTATNFIANQTGLYPDRNGVTQSNTFNYYGQAGQTHPGVSFAYWTDPIYDYTGNNTDQKYNAIYAADRAAVPNHSNVNVPAPWVPYTRAGCNVGEVGMANTALENTSTDINTVFGPDSPEAAEAKDNSAKAQADYVGLAVHCGANTKLCDSGNPDLLPDEPGGYHGYQALFGNAEIQPAVHPSGPMTALDGTTIADANGNPGFPGFDSETPNVSLGYAAALLEHGVQVQNIYLSDVHGDHTAAQSGDLGPGEQTYEQQLHDYDQGFARFFRRLARDGITPQNTLFSVATDEGDHFAGSAPTPADCTGQPGHYCHYDTKSEVNVNLPGLLATKAGNTTPFAIHNDPAPALWVTGNPRRGSATMRTLARDISRLRITNPYTGRREKVAYQLADPVEEKILHFVSSDGLRTPSLTFFSGEDSYVGSGAANCDQSCVYTTGAGYAWNHGGLWPDMQTIWSAYAGPGVQTRGIDSTTFADQTDNRPTLLALTGLRDDYRVDGRALVEELSPSALPVTLRQHRDTLLALGRVYKQLLASTGSFDMATLAASTHGLQSSSERVYRRTERTLAALGAARDRLTRAMADELLGATFDHRAIDEWAARRQLRRGAGLLRAAHRLAFDD